METCNGNTILSDVKEYYGKTLSSSCDLKTNACTTSKRKLTPFLKETLGMIHDEVVAKYVCPFSRNSLPLSFPSLPPSFSHGSGNMPHNHMYNVTT